MKHLVIGASGLVGSYICKEIQKDTGQKVIGTYFKNDLKDTDFTSVKLDITNFKETFNILKAIDPDVIYIPASLTDVDYCENNPEESLKINVEAVANIALATSGIKNCLIIYFSSDYVFGNPGLSKVEDIPSPLNIYGQHKLLAEHYIATTSKSWVIIRTSNVFGSHPLNKSFASRILKSIKKKEQIYAKSDQIDTPTYAGSLANFAKSCAYSWKGKSLKRNIFHFSSGEFISRADFAKLIVDKVSPVIPGFHSSKIVEPISVNDDSYKIAKRPSGGLFCDGESLESMIQSYREDIVKQIKEGNL